MSVVHKKSKWSSHVKVWLLALSLLLPLWAGVAWTNHQSEAQGLEEVRRETAALALLFAKHTERTFLTADLALQEVRVQWLRGSADPGQAIRAHLDLLGDAIVQVGIIDAKGSAVYSSLGLPKKPIYAGDREHFKVHLNTATDRLFVSRPTKGQVSGKWSLQLSRPIFKEAALVGVVVISVNPQYFVNFYKGAGLGKEGAARMIRDTGEIMARSSEHERYVGKVVRPSPYADPGAPLQGSFRRRAQSDGVDRLSSYHRLPQFGLTVVIGPGLDERLAPVRRHQTQLVLAAGALSLLIVLMAWLLTRNMRRDAASRRALRESEEKFHSLFFSMSEGVALHQLVNDAQGTPLDYRIVEVNPAFEVQTGLTRNAVESRLATQAYDVPVAPFLDIYAKVAQTGQPVNFEGSFGPDAKVFRIQVFSPKKGQFATVCQDITESKRLQALQEADHVELASQYTEIVQLQKKLLIQVLRDPLTGLYNRRYLEDALPRELSRASREGYPLALVMLDLDHFKTINDTYGHAAGDAVLVAVTTLFKNTARDSDIVCRYGGEEFLVLMPRMSPAQAFKKIDAWRRAIADTVIPHAGVRMHCTISAGVAGFPHHGANRDTLVKQADDALYQSKHAGRNRVTVAGFGSDL